MKSFGLGTVGQRCPHLRSARCAGPTRDEPAAPPARAGARAEEDAAGAAGPGLLARLVRRAVAALKPPPELPGRLVFESVEPRVLLAGDAVVPRVEGRIDVPGEVDQYTFTLQNDVRVVFDSLTPNSGVEWSLDGPAGSVVSGRSFRQTDSVDQSAPPVLGLKAGNYTLSVDGTGDTTGDYAFRLIDLGKAAALTPGIEVTGNLTPANETDAYTFSAIAGQRFYFDRTVSGSDTWWRLIGPDGKALWGPDGMGSDEAVVTVAQTGVYTLLVEGRVTSTATATNTAYAFTVQQVVDKAATLALGATVEGSIDLAGQRTVYTFDLAARTQALFDSLTNVQNLRWSLAGPAGDVVAPSAQRSLPRRTRATSAAGTAGIRSPPTARCSTSSPAATR